MFNFSLSSGGFPVKTIPTYPPLALPSLHLFDDGVLRNGNILSGQSVATSLATRPVVAKVAQVVNHIFHCLFETFCIRGEKRF